MPWARSMLLLAVVLTMSGAGQPSSSVDSFADFFGVDEPPAGSAQRGDQFLGDMFGWDADDHGAATSMHTAAQVNPGRSTRAPLPERAAAGPSRQGTYDRNGTVARRLSHAEYAWNHLRQAEDHAIGVPCDEACPYDRKCGRNFTPATLLAAHVLA